MCCFYASFLGFIHYWIVFHCLAENYRKRVKILLKDVDIISERARWIHGLSSFAIFVLIGFTCWFSITYLRLYLFEK
jgi:hypothetical protein